MRSQRIEIRAGLETGISHGICLRVRYNVYHLFKCVRPERQTFFLCQGLGVLIIILRAFDRIIQHGCVHSVIFPVIQDVFC